MAVNNSNNSFRLRGMIEMIEMQGVMSRLNWWALVVFMKTKICTLVIQAKKRVTFLVSCVKNGACFRKIKRRLLQVELVDKKTISLGIGTPKPKLKGPSNAVLVQLRSSEWIMCQNSISYHFWNQDLRWHFKMTSIGYSNLKSKTELIWGKLWDLQGLTKTCCLMRKSKKKRRAARLKIMDRLVGLINWVPLEKRSFTLIRLSSIMKPWLMPDWLKFQRNGIISSRKHSTLKMMQQTIISRLKISVSFKRQSLLHAKHF